MTAPSLIGLDGPGSNACAIARRRQLIRGSSSRIVPLSSLVNHIASGCLLAWTPTRSAAENEGESDRWPKIGRTGCGATRQSRFLSSPRTGPHSQIHTF